MSKIYGLACRFLKGYTKNISKEFTKAIKEEQKEAIKEIYENERKRYADQARKLFNALCRQGKIRKEQQKSLRYLLENCLGDYVEEYKGWKFDNEFHRLYTYLRSYHLDEGDWNRIQTFLEQIQKSS